jgi:hypothetical protein
MSFKNGGYNNGLGRPKAKKLFAPARCSTAWLSVESRWPVKGELETKRCLTILDAVIEGKRALQCGAWRVTITQCNGAP